MKLTKHQISKIDEKVELDNNRTIVCIDVSDPDEDLTIEETLYNIYCVNKDYEIIWRVKEIGTEPIDECDFFSYLGKFTDDEESITVGANVPIGTIIACRFSRYQYKIDTDTGIATRIAFLGYH